MKKSFNSLVDMQERSCKAFANNRFLGYNRGDGYSWITYKEFDEAVKKFRSALASLGVKRGDTVSIISDNRPEWAIAAFATFSLGAKFTAMYETQMAKDWKYIIEDSDSVVTIVANEKIYETVSPWVNEIEKLKYVICIDAPAEKEYSFEAQLKKGAEAGEVEPVHPSESDTAILIYTSGTTGKPKGVILSHGNVVSNINAVHEFFPLTQEDVSLCFLPWAHSFGQVCELYLLMSTGASLGITSPKKLLENAKVIRPTILFAVPRVFNKIYDTIQKKLSKAPPLRQKLFQKGMDVATKRRRLAEENKRSLLLDLQYAFFDKLIFSKIRDLFGGRMRYAISGGAALSKEVAEFIDNINILVFEGYGLTETSPIVSVNYPGCRKIGTVGRPIPGVEVYICDEEQKVLPQGEEGEIVVVGPNVMQGYYKKKEETDKVIFDLDGKRAFRTGDMGKIDDDGFLVITGRFKEQYKLENGKYVVPTPLEEHLKLSGFINQAFIFGANKPYNVALIVPDFEALREWAKEQGIQFNSDKELIQNEKVHQKIGEEIEKFSTEFKGYEKPKKWALLEEEFTVENDMMTPKMSLKRRNIIKTYKDLIESLYSEEAKASAA